MSAQTGRRSLPPPPSSRRIDLARARVQRIRNDPNPVWMRELRQAARLGRTPVILAVLTGMMTLLMASVGGVASVSTEPAKVGVALFHTFFSIAFFVVTWIGPTVAASTIASERGGRTWEALLLTGLGAPTIARGKFLASLTYVGLYIVMLAPVGAMPFLFGGVTATEVLAAFALLGLFAVLSVAFGLSISSKFSNTAGAIGVTLLAAVPLSIIAYLGLGVGLSFAAHKAWPAVPSGPPVWLPTAYVRADFGIDYVVFLVLAPVVLAVLPAWFLYEATVSNMAGLSDDRSTGIRRWFLVSMPLVVIASIAPAFAPTGDPGGFAVIGLGIASIMCAFSAFVFCGEPIGPSRRVELHWQRSGAGAFQRYLGPGVMRAISLLLVLGLTGLALQTAAGFVLEATSGGGTSIRDAQRVLCFGGYAMGFVVFVAGFAAWSRARARSAAAPRLLLLAALFLAMVGPWILMAIAGLISNGNDNAMIVAAPSPTYAIVMMKALDHTGVDHDLPLLAGAGCAVGWALVGFALLASARGRARRVVREHAEAVAQLDQRLREEDEAQQAEAAPDAAAEAAAS